MSEKNRTWYAVRTKPQQEALAVMHYRRQGFHVYLPRVETTRSHARKKEVVRRPLFPGYIFLHLAPQEQHWTAISSTIGAIGPVRFGDYFPPVPDWVISGLQARENGTGCVSLRAMGDKMLRKGKKVMVTMGEQDVEGVFLKFRDQERVVILLDMLQRQLQVVAPLALLKIA